MSYHYRLFSTVDDVDRDAWEAVQQYDPSPFLDLRFLRLINNTLSDTSRCWPLLITDESDLPVAIACLSLLHVDGSILAGPIIRAVTTGMRTIRPNFLRLPLLILGLPVSTGQSPVVWHPDADMPEVQDALLRAIVEMEQQERPSVTLAKEFDESQAAELQGLTASSFLEVNSLPMHEFPAQIGDFDSYVSMRRSKSRHNIRRSRRKLEDGNIEVKQLRGIDGALDYLTDDAHRLYVAVYEKSATKFEFLPLAYFRSIARNFPEESWFTFLIHDGRVIAFSFRLAYRCCVHMLYLGVDYTLNRQFDLYFNLLYEDLDGALRMQPETIYFGQNSSEVKLRLGCQQSRRTLFVRGHRLWRPLIKRFSQYIFRIADAPSAPISTSLPAVTETRPPVTSSGTTRTERAVADRFKP